MQDVFLCRKSIQRQYAECIDNFFTKYGYACDEVKVPPRNNRKEYTYVKTKDCLLIGQMPSDDNKKFCNIMNNGITWWKDPSQVGNYGIERYRFEIDYNSFVRFKVEKFMTKIDVDINEEAVDEFFSKSTIDEYVAHQIAEFGEDFFDGEAKLVIKKNELVDVLNENLEVFESELGIHLTSQETRGIVDYIIDGDEVCVVTTDDIKHSNSALYYAFNIGFSYITMGIFIFLSAFIILFMILNSFTQSTCGMGVVFVILGGLTSLSAMLAEWIYPLWEAIFNGSVIGALSGGFVVVNASIGVVLLVIGVAMLVTHIILKKHRKENPTAV
jgi:hypothetical protein